MSVHQSDQELPFYSLLSRLMPISYTRGILEWAIVGFPLNVHPKLVCLSAPLHQISLLEFIL